MELTKILKALADENRLRILNLLAQQYLCVCEIEAVLGFTQSNASRHLTKLKEAGIISQEKQGQFVFHRLQSGIIEKSLFLKLLITDLPGIPEFKADLDKLAELKASGNLCVRESCAK
jgi:ArsR family transcriptional regulator, arsenate/arsenite/antimonite-responsive transcriptional repressor